MDLWISLPWVITTWHLFLGKSHWLSPISSDFHSPISHDSHIALIQYHPHLYPILYPIYPSISHDSLVYRIYIRYKPWIWSQKGEAAWPYDRVLHLGVSLREEAMLPPVDERCIMYVYIYILYTYIHTYIHIQIYSIYIYMRIHHRVDQNVWQNCPYKDLKWSSHTYICIYTYIHRRQCKYIK